MDREYYDAFIFDNSLIMSNILAFLTLEDIKNVRLVSKSFALQSIQPLQKRSFVKMYSKSTNPYISATEASEMFVHPNLALCHNMNYPDSVQNNVRILKFFQQIETTSPGRVRFLRIILDSSDPDFLTSLIQSVPNLDKLEVIVGPNASLENESKTPDIKSGHFHSLKNLAMVFANIETKQAKGLLAPIFVTLFNKSHSPGNIERIEIFDKSRKSIIAAGVFRKMNQWNFHKLNNVQLTYGGAAVLRQLNLTNCRLQVLKAGIVSWMDLKILRELLVKHATTLVEFEVEVSTGTKLTPNSKCTGTSTFEMPTLPKLRKLGYAVGKLPVHLLLGSGKCTNGMMKHYHALATLDKLTFLDYMNISKILQSGSTTFKTTFPSLTDLELKLCGGYNKHHDIFFSNVGPDVSITQVKMFSMELPNWGSSEECSSLIERISKIFPNVENPQFEGMEESVCDEDEN